METNTDRDHEKKPDLTALILKGGAHVERDDGVCLLEAVAWVAGEPHSDHPACTSKILGAMGRGINDGLRSDEERTKYLTPFIPRLVGTVGTPEQERRRVFLAYDFLIRQAMPAGLAASSAAHLQEHAAALRGLPEITTTAQLNAAAEMVATASRAAQEHYLGVLAGVRAGVRDGVLDGVRAGVRAGVRDGVRAGVLDGVRAGVRDGVRDGVRAKHDHLKSCETWGEGWDVGYEVARSTTSSASKAIVDEKANEVGETILAGVLALFDRMIAVTEAKPEAPAAA